VNKNILNDQTHIKHDTFFVPNYMTFWAFHTY